MKIFEKPPGIIQSFEQRKKQSIVPIDKGQFTLETEEREQQFEKNRGSENPDGYKDYREKWNKNPRNFVVAEFHSMLIWS
jgi:hypothetical protein